MVGRSTFLLCIHHMRGTGPWGGVGGASPQVLQGNLGSAQQHKTPEKVSTGPLSVCGPLLTKCGRSTVNHLKGPQEL